jgi:hypothetical protein
VGKFAIRDQGKNLNGNLQNNAEECSIMQMGVNHGKSEHVETE